MFLLSNLIIHINSKIIIKFKYPILSVLIIFILVYYLEYKKTPIPTGDAKVYWQYACGVDIDQNDGYYPFARNIGLIPNKGDWFFYYYIEHHGRHVFKVHKKELLLLSDKLLNHLNNRSKSRIFTRFDNEEEKNRRRVKCLNDFQSSNNSISVFLNNFNQSLTDNHKLNYQTRGFDVQWQKYKLFWFSVLFEASFISFWWLFTFHTGIFGKINTSISNRVAFSPLIFFIPYFFGYAPSLFSSSVNGEYIYSLFGAILYIPFTWVPSNPIDLWIFKLLPNPLFHISQTSFAASATSYLAVISPTVLVLYSIIVKFIPLLVNNRRKKI